MTLVKYNDEIVEILAKGRSSMTILTEESLIKKISVDEISSISIVELDKKIKRAKSKKIINLREYRNFKRYKERRL